VSTDPQHNLRAPPRLLTFDLAAFSPSAAVPLSPTGLFPAQPVGGVPRGPPRTGDGSFEQKPSRAPSSEASTPFVVEPSFAPLGPRGALRPDQAPAHSGYEQPEPGAFHHRPVSDRSRPPTQPRERDRGRLRGLATSPSPPGPVSGRPWFRGFERPGQLRAVTRSSPSRTVRSASVASAT